MTRIRQCVTIVASPAVVWSAVENIESHVQWMKDARTIEFRGRQHSGVGAEFECLTVVGPFRIRDVFRVTEWRPREAMGIEHRGVVTGSGRFTLRRTWRGRTRFCWEERLTFPWWMGGTVGGWLAKPFLKHVWRANLRRLKARVETQARVT